ncbi:ParA family protein [Propionibacteriaceae bacterium G1746]|uniref:ParA family protein n=1 Tax=Aestuariimicrobium sp. G57 TaxID=3418485 RepID=UPI003C1B641B
MNDSVDVDVSRETFEDPVKRPKRAHYPTDETPPEFVEPEVDVSRETALPRVLPQPVSPRIIVVANQKGGVGKTTSTVNLAAALALGGLKVLVIDVDPQGNASTALGVDHEQGTEGTYEILLEGASIADVAAPSPEPGHLWVVPATIDLAAAELELVSAMGRERRLDKAVQRYIARNEVDYIFFDCPPSLGLLTLNALVAATEILVPIQCEYYALEGVSQLLRTINMVTGELNNSLRLGTVLLTMYDKRNTLSKDVAAEVRKHFPEQTLPVEIPRSVRVSEAPGYRSTVLSYDSKSAGAVAYREAAAEIARRNAGSK